MKYIFLAGSLIFGIAGISQAMDVFTGQGTVQTITSPVIYNFQYFTISFQPVPGFIKIILLSLGFFSLFLIWQKLKRLGFGRLSEYTPY